MCLLASSLLAVSSGLLASPQQDVRVLQVKAVIDRASLGGSLEQVQVARRVREASFVFGRAFGLRFSVKQFAYWSPPSARLPLPCLMDRFLNEVGPEDADIVIGFVSPDRTDSRSLGIASYAHGALLVMDVESDRLMTLLLVHELCHLFGAVDLNSSGSIMSASGIRLHFDPFTAKVVSVHRSRAFGAAARFLPDRDLYDILMTYRERAALDLGEVGLNLLLACLCLEWDARQASSGDESGRETLAPAVDWVGEAVRQCEKALACRPEWAAAHHVLGVALAREGDPERARTCLARAMDLAPGGVIRH